MTTITGKPNIFFVTSPRTPIKMVDEVRFLVENFEGKTWDTETQKAYYIALCKQPFFEGGESSDPAFSARDRITRGPKSLGLVDLAPTIELTAAGRAFVYGERRDEALLRQMLKLQFPSPYHTDSGGVFAVKPYLELMRLVHGLGGLTKTEIALFVIQLTNYTKFDTISEKIKTFRAAARTNREQRKLGYREFVAQYFGQELKQQYSSEIKKGEIGTRESDEATLEDFLYTKQRNHLDYADAAIRYLRATSLFTFDARSLRVSVMPERSADVEHILATVPRDPGKFTDEDAYGKYLFPADTPVLLTDNPAQLTENILKQNKNLSTESLSGKSTEELKSIFSHSLTENLERILAEQRELLRTYSEYDDIQDMFDRIGTPDIADSPLFLEWNTWRALEMLDDGTIVGNFRVDDNGSPLYTAPGNTPDIICKYTDFETIVEVTLSSGQRQYEMEGEPVLRHYGNHRRSTEKPVYAVFIAPRLNPATIAHYFTAARTNIQYYGGKSLIIPLTFDAFKRLLANARGAASHPTSRDLHQLFKKLTELAETSETEVQWYQAIETEVAAAFQAPSP